MAISGALDTSNPRVKFTISIIQNYQSVSDNTSNVTVSIRYYRTNTGYTTYGTGTIYCKIDGTTYSASVTPSQGITNAGIVLFTKTLTIAHSSDGSKRLTCSSWLTHNAVTASEQSFSADLTNIPRKSSLSVNYGTLGSSVSMIVTKSSFSFTHTITASCGGSRVTICTKDSVSNQSYTPPISWASNNTNGSDVTITYTIETFNGSTSLGSNSYAVKCYIPDSVKPSASFTASDPDGYFAKYGGYVQSKSRVSFSITASGSHGSSIATYRTVVDGRTYVGTPVTSNVLTGSGNLSANLTVTDSRSRSETASATLSVLPYSSPKISALNVQRCTSNGVASSNGAYLKIIFSSAIMALNNKNSATYTIKYKKVADASYTTHTLTGYAGNYNVANGTYIFAADTASSYDIIMSAKDDFSEASLSASGSAVSKLWSALSKGMGFAFGKVAELQNTVEFAFNTAFHKPMTLDNNTTFNVKNGSGTARNWLYMDANSNMIIGQDAYTNWEADTNFYSNRLNLYSRSGIRADGRPLWPRVYGVKRAQHSFTHGQSYGYTKVTLTDRLCASDKIGMYLSSGEIVIQDSDIKLVRVSAHLEIQELTCYMGIVKNDSYEYGYLSAPQSSNIGYYMWEQNLTIPVTSGDRIGIRIGKNTSFTTTIQYARLVVEAIG